MHEAALLSHPSSSVKTFCTAVKFRLAERKCKTNTMSAERTGQTLIRIYRTYKLHLPLILIIMYTHQAELCFKLQRAQDVKLLPWRAITVPLYTKHIFCRLYSPCSSFVAEPHLATAWKVEPTIPACYWAAEVHTDLQCVHTRLRLFRHVETNMEKCDIYPWQTSCLLRGFGQGRVFISQQAARTWDTWEEQGLDG